VQPEFAAIPVLFADADFAVLDKPPGLPVHPGPRRGPSVEDWFPALARGRAGPWLAHRLDADTSGCLVVARRRAALLAAQAAFAAGRVRKIYWAIVSGHPPGQSGRVELPLAKRTGPSGWRMVADPAGQPAITDWVLRGRADGMSWLELRPRTGRTHQLRVHCAGLDCPILGDAVYGSGGPQLHLVARAVDLPLDPPLHVVAPPPAHMQVALRQTGWDPATAEPPGGRRAA